MARRGPYGATERRRAEHLLREAHEVSRAMARLAYLIGRSERRNHVRV